MVLEAFGDPTIANADGGLPYRLNFFRYVFSRKN